MPNVTWWRDNKILMDASFNGGTDEVINDLEIVKLERLHNGAILSCRVVNNILAPVAVASVKILMHCKSITLCATNCILLVCV